MQKAVAKYGLAAHLALLAVAPLFLFPFCGDKEQSVTLLWLCLLATVWLVLSPSLLGGEMLDDARRRVLYYIVRDPLFWILVAILLVAGFRALNSGINVSFDYEMSEWKILPPTTPFLPGSFESSGLLPFVAVLSAVIVVLGCRHALGKSARMMFLLLLTVLSGIAALVALFLLGSGDETVAAAVSAAPERFLNPGVGFAICFLCSTTALFAAMEQDWGKSAPLLFGAAGGNAAAAFVFLPPREAIAFALAYMVLLAFSGLFGWRCLKGGRGVTALLVVLFSIVLSCGAVNMSMPDDALDGKLSAYAFNVSEEKERADVRGVLSDVVFKVWPEHPWTGVGVGAFQFYPRFNLTPERLGALPRLVRAVPNGWLHLLVERGIVGAAMVVFPLLFLLFSWLCGAFRCIRAGIAPGFAVALAPLALAAVVFSAFYSASMLRAEVLALAGAIMVISAKAFPKGDSNG